MNQPQEFRDVVRSIRIRTLREKQLARAGMNTSVLDVSCGCIPRAINTDALKFWFTDQRKLIGSQ